MEYGVNRRNKDVIDEEVAVESHDELVSTTDVRGIITYAKSTNALAPVETFQMTKLGSEYMVS